MAQKYTAAKWTADAMQAELVKRGFDEADIIDMGEEELRAQLINDDAGGSTVTAEDEETTSEEPTDTDEADAPAKPVKAGKGESVDVVKGEEYIRTFTKSVHGADFRALAEEFAGKDARRSILEDGVIKKLKVNYRIQDKKPGNDQGAWKAIVEVFTDKDANFKAAALKFRNNLPGDMKTSVTFTK